MVSLRCELKEGQAIGLVYSKLQQYSGIKRKPEASDDISIVPTHVFMKSIRSKPRPFFGSVTFLSASKDCRLDFLLRLRFFAPDSAVLDGGVVER